MSGSGTSDRPPLPAAAAAATARARARGALESIPTRVERVRDGGVEFVVRVIERLAEKPRDPGSRRDEAARGNPFLPYDPEMHVAEVAPSHVCLLNKYNVVDGHLLVVTRAFVHQERPLGGDDFAALASCLAALDGLGFYNAGPAAGASQPHRHLQLVPRAIAPGLDDLPVAPLVERACASGATRVEAFPFRHGLAALDPEAGPMAAARAMHAAYRTLLEATQVRVRARAGEPRTDPYNLLVTRAWMLLVPRTHEHFEGVSVNALAFAGALLAPGRDERDRLLQRGPMAVLAGVAPAGAGAR